MKRLMLVLLVGLLSCGSAFAQEKKKIVLVAGKPSHGFGGHEHNAGCRLLAKALNESGLPVEAVVVENGWPKDDKVFDGAAAVIMYCDGGNGHMVLPHLKEVDALNDKGVGIGCIHYAVEPGDEKAKPSSGRPELLKWIGGYFETFYSVNPDWRGTFDKLPEHPVTRGVKPFATTDEWYYHMRFRENMAGVTPILSAVPPDSTRKKKDDAHGGNEHVRADIGKNVAEHVVWVSQNDNGSRGFGCTGAHHHMNWWQDDFRKTILNAIIWTAKVEVPADGVKSQRPAAEEYLNQDEKVPEKFNMDDFKRKVEEMNKPLEAKADAK
jgi:type 1 glutamine amidotransferase